MSNDIDETAAGGRKDPANSIVDATGILTGGDALDLVSVDSGDRAKTYLIDLDLIAAAFSGGLTLGQLNFFGNSGAQGTDGRETLDLLKEIEATSDDRRDPDNFVDDGGSRQRLELFETNDAGEAVASDDLLALILAAIDAQADLEFFETETGFDIHIGGRWSTDILRFEGATAQQLADDLLPPVNTAPDAVDDAISINEGTGVGTLGSGILGNDTDLDGDDLTIISVNGDAANVGVAQSGASGLTYTILSSGGFSVSSSDNSLGVGESVTETITYTISDGNGGTDTATFTVTVNGRNDDPVALDDTITLSAGETLTDVLALILANDSDVDGDDLTVLPGSFEFVDGFGDLAGVVIEFEDGAFTTFEVTAMEGVSGTTSFTYEVSDGNGGTDTATVTVEIEAADTGTELLVDFNDFEPNPDPDFVDFISTGGMYQGFTWDASASSSPLRSVVILDWDNDGELDAISNNTPQWSLTRDGDSFDFISGDLGAGFGTTGSPITILETVDVIGLRDGVEVYSENVSVSPDTMTPYDFNFLDIDELVFRRPADEGPVTTWGMDDLLFVV